MVQPSTTRNQLNTKEAMSKIIEKSNYRVVVEPKTGPHYFSRTQESILAEEKSACEEMVEQIKRHVDMVGRIDVEYDTEEICSYCKLQWEVDEQTGEPQCCTKAQVEFSEQKNNV